MVLSVVGGGGGLRVPDPQSADIFMLTMESKKVFIHLKAS